MNTIVDFNTSKASSKIKGRLNSLVQSKLDNLVLRDSNYYAPMDTGMLIDSGITGSNIGTGILEWRTPYARAQYYGLPNKSKDKNPNAQMKWFEVAKVKNKNKWVIMSRRWYGGK